MHFRVFHDAQSDRGARSYGPWLTCVWVRVRPVFKFSASSSVIRPSTSSLLLDIATFAATYPQKHRHHIAYASPGPNYLTSTKSSIMPWRMGIRVFEAWLVARVE